MTWTNAKPPEGKVRTSRYSDGLALAVDVITFGSGVTEEQMHGFLEHYHCRLLSEVEKDLFSLCYPEVDIHMTGRFLVVKHG